jgi:hypothetical protein
MDNCENSERLDSVQTTYFYRWAGSLIDREIKAIPAEKNISQIRIITKDKDETKG